MKYSLLINKLILGFLLIISMQTAAQLNKVYFFNQGRYYLSRDEFTEAISTLNQLIRADSTIAEAWFLRGVAKYNLNDFHGALADFSKSIRHNPVYSQAYLYRAIVYNRLSRYTQALQDYEMAIDLRPSFAEVYYSRGITYLLIQDFHKSIEDFTKTIKFQPNNVDAWINRGTAKLLDADTLGAMYDYNHAIRLNPFYSESYSKRGRLFYETGDFEMALSDLSKALSIDSTATINLFFRALTHHALENDADALTDLNKAIAQAPENALSIYNRALILWKNGNLKDALNDFDQVVTLNPNNILVYYNRAVLHYEMEDFSEAIFDFTASINLFPDFANAYMGRSSAYARLDDRYKSDRDRAYAQSIAERFSDSHSQPWTDTTQKFDNLVAFSSDFSPRNPIPSLEEYDTKPIDILPFIRVGLTNRMNLKSLSQDFVPIDTLNEQLSDFEIRIRFNTLKEKTDFQHPDSIVNNPFLRKLIHGILQSAENKYNQAASSYREAISLDPKNPLAMLNLAVEMAEMVSFIATFEKEVGAVDLSQTARRSRQSSSTTSIQLVSFEESLEILNQLEILIPDDPIVKYNIGNIYALSGEFENAKNLFSSAIDITPSLPEAWYNRGLIHLMQKETEKGCSDLGKAGELGIKQAYLLIHRFCRQ